jgi:hypothetical protein
VVTMPEAAVRVLPYGQLCSDSKAAIMLRN